MTVLLILLTLWETVYSGSYAVFLLKCRNIRGGAFVLTLIFGVLVLLVLFFQKIC